ncbi:MAG: hypothetical protein ACFFB3_03950 [Candidatus Hodarchaeota archaeon]
MEDTDRRFLAPLATSVLGIILMLIFSFARWEERLNYAGDTLWRSYGLSPLGTWGWDDELKFFDVPAELQLVQLMLFLILVGMAYCASISVIGFRFQDRLSRKLLRSSTILSAILTIGVGFAALLFDITLSGLEDPIWNTHLPGIINNWWLDTGAYAGIISNILTTALFLYLYRIKAFTDQN